MQLLKYPLVFCFPFQMEQVKFLMSWKCVIEYYTIDWFLVIDLTNTPNVIHWLRLIASSIILKFVLSGDFLLDSFLINYKSSRHYDRICFDIQLKGFLKLLFSKSIESSDQRYIKKNSSLKLFSMTHHKIQTRQNLQSQLSGK